MFESLAQEVIELAKNRKTLEIEFFDYVVCEGCKKTIRIGEDVIVVAGASPENIEVKGKFKGIISLFQDHELRGEYILVETEEGEIPIAFFGMNDYAVCSEECDKKYQQELNELFRSEEELEELIDEKTKKVMGKEKIW